MKLIAHWKQAWKLHSVRIFAMIALLPVAWESVPDYIKNDLPTGWVKWIAGALALVGIWSRLVAQPDVTKEKPDDSANP